jgi:hypothetical protein
VLDADVVRDAVREDGKSASVEAVGAGVYLDITFENGLSHGAASERS